MGSRWLATSVRAAEAVRSSLPGSISISESVTLLELRVAEDVTDESQGKDVASRPNDRNLRHVILAFDANDCRIVCGVACFTNQLERRRRESRPLCDIFDERNECERTARQWRS